MTQKSLLTVADAMSGRILSSKCIWAKDSLTRLVGLLGHESLSSDESMLIEPCKQVHTLFMRFPIDVVFLDKNNHVLECLSMKPWRFSPLRLKASKILEFPLGHCKKMGIEAGQSLKFISESCDA